MTKQIGELLTDLFVGGGNDLVRYLKSKLPNEEDARDLAQEAYLRLLRLERTDLIRQPEAYLFRIATNLVHEYWLGQKRSVSSTSDEIDLDNTPTREGSLEKQTEDRQAIDELGRVLNLLPPMQKQVVLLHRRDGMTYAEIAEKLDISPHMVKKYLIKGLARCREYLRHHR